VGFPIERSALIAYKYDKDNRRIEKKIGGTITLYFYDGDSINPLYETDGKGNDMYTLQVAYV
jgi:hypothetical protein